MVIIKFPEQFYDSFDTFKEGKYSEMFTKEAIKELFTDFDSDAVRVIKKDSSYKVTFTKRLNEKFNLKGKFAILPKEWQGEFDFPPVIDEETFK